MQSKLEKHLVKQFFFFKEKKLLLATSGGLDSMVMVHLFQKLNYTIAIAHCNFQLRGMESFGDQNFIQEYSQEYQIPVFITQFDTKAFAEDYKLSTQVAARELRYNWFYELMETKEYDYILTAHHADDSLETFIINLTRGTGLDGLTGIPKQNELIIRPLLPFTRQEIIAFAQENQIEWREDSSNASDKYLRNKIRHDLVPLLKVLNPQFMEAFQKTQTYLQEASAMVEDASIMVYQQVVTQEDDLYYINLKQLLKLPNYQSYLYQWLKDFGFTAWEDIYDLVDGLSGKQIFSTDFRIIKDRQQLIVCPIIENDTTEEFYIEKETVVVNLPLKLSFSAVEAISTASNSTIFVDQDQLKYPLTIRKWKTADTFHPLGMNGKSKKLSKFFKDEKLSLVEKEQTWLLCSDNQIVWVIGLRPDERFKITEKTKNRLQIALI